MEVVILLTAVGLQLLQGSEAFLGTLCGGSLGTSAAAIVWYTYLERKKDGAKQ